MRRKSPVLIILVVVLISLPLLLKGAMYLRVKLAMDDLVAQSAGRFEITYDSIATELKGAATVAGIRIRPAGFEQNITVEQVRVATDDPWVFVAPDTWVGGEGEALPERLQINAFTVRIPLEQAVQDTLLQQSPLAQFGSEGCDSLNIDPVQLRGMGFEALTLDLALDYRFDAADKELELGLEFDLHQIESVSLAMRLSGFQPGNLNPDQLARLRFAMADLRVRMEPAFGERLVAHCAAQEGVPPQQYQQQLMRSLRKNLAQSGITLGPELQAAIEGFYREWGDIRIYLKPEEPLGMLQMAGLTPERLEQALGISLFFNDSLVQDLEVDIDLNARRGGPFASSEGHEKQSSPLTPRVRILREFHRIDPVALPGHIGRVVRIQPEGQPVREGVLTTIVDGEAQVRRRTRGGTVTSHVPLHSIVSVEVEEVRRVPLN